MLVELALINNTCYSFNWMSLKAARSDSHLSSPEISPSVLQSLFGAVAEPFPPMFTFNTVQITHYIRCSETLKFTHSPVINSTEALHVRVLLARAATSHGNIFHCVDKAYISMLLVCDGTVDCPGDAWDEIGCECNTTEVYSSKCKYILDSSSRRTCSVFYIPTVTNDCSRFVNEKVTSPPDITRVPPETSLCKRNHSLDLKEDNDNDSGSEWMTKVQNLRNTDRLCGALGKIQCSPRQVVCYDVSEICSYKLNITGDLVPCISGEYIQKCETFQCDKMFKCSGYYCVPWGYLCDTKWDCPGGVDELEKHCAKSQLCTHLFKCRAVRSVSIFLMHAMGLKIVHMGMMNLYVHCITLSVPLSANACYSL